MTTLHARLVDPRDATWEEWNPSYRVYFWSAHDEGWASRVFDITGADLDAVLGWVDENGEHGETVTLFAIVDHRGERGLVRLSGADPTRSA